MLLIMRIQKCRLLAVLFISGILVGCMFISPKQEQTQESTESEDVKFLKGQYLEIDSIINNTNTVRVVYLFNYYDCETCIYDGFSIVNQIDKYKGHGYVTVIESRCPEVNSLQKKGKYYGYIYSDKNDKIRKMLKYTPTPVLLLLDDSKRIIDALIIDMQQSKNEINRFVHNCCKS